MSINPHDDTYLSLLKDILKNGEKRDDRTGVGTLSVFGRQMRFDLQKGFPLLTTKRVAWKAVVSELLWFIEGSGDERRLAEILYGKPREELTDKTTIWTANANSPYWKPKAKFPGDCGRPYGVIWRDWRVQSHCNGSAVGYDENDNEIPVTLYKSIDQLKRLVEGIKNDPYSRRHILSAWNVGELDNMALPPCHVMSQYYVSNGKLSCHMYQRSCDYFLGASFNIASYALLTTMIAHVCDLEVGDLIISIGDTHLYLNHLEQAKEQLSREPRVAPLVKLNSDTKILGIDSFTMEDIDLIGYDPHPSIKADMAV